MKAVTGPEIQREGLAALRERLGIRGLAHFLQDMGMASGNYTEDRYKFYADASIEDILADIEQLKKSEPDIFRPRQASS